MRPPRVRPTSPRGSVLPYRLLTPQRGMLAAQNPREDSTRDARSSPTHATHYARVVAQTAPEVRVARVEAARRALQEGTLTLDGQALADTLLQAVRAERRHA